jgi:hypothetical protein
MTGISNVLTSSSNVMTSYLNVMNSPGHGLVMTNWSYHLQDPKILFLMLYNEDDKHAFILFY